VGLKIGDGIIDNCIPGVNGCTIDGSFGPKGESGAVFWVILSAHRDINLPSV
jgi:hypothetical protein